MFDQKVNFERVVNSQEIFRKTNVSFWTEIRDYLVYFLKCAAVVFCAYLFIKSFMFQTVEVDGDSMTPNYVDEDIVYINKLATTFGDVRRGDVVVVERPDGDCTGLEEGKKCFFIKRVVGIPGDEIIIKDGFVYVKNQDTDNETRLDETDYFSNLKVTDADKRIDNIYVEENSYFVMGDNREGSKDSRDIGLVDIKDIQGKEFYHRDFGFFESPDYNLTN